MTRLVWNSSGERLFEAGVDRGVFFPGSSPGVAWNGIVSVTEGDADSEVDTRFFDGQKYRSRRTGESYAAELEAVTYPLEFEPYSGFSNDLFAHQRRKPFGFSYRSLVGNDIEGLDKGYKIHLVYNAFATPSSRNFKSLGEGYDPVFSWTLTSSPIYIPDAKNTSHLIIDSRFVYPWVMAEVENLIYGSETTDAKLPTISELIDIFQSGSILRVDINPDKTATITGPESAFSYPEEGKVTITWPSVEEVADGKFVIKSL